MRRFLKRLLLKSLNQTDAILNSFKLFYTLYFVHFILVITFINSYQGKKEKKMIYFSTHVGVRRKSFCSSDSSMFSVSGGLSVFSSMGDFKVDFFGFFLASHRMPPSGQVSLHLKL